jgi:hypothetical protein
MDHLDKKEELPQDSAQMRTLRWVEGWAVDLADVQTIHSVDRWVL